MRLYLVRHAIAFDADPARWPDDADRPLTPRGRRRFRTAARGLRRLAPAVDVLLASPYARTRATAELLHRFTRWPVPIAADGLAGHAPLADQLAALVAHGEAGALAAVGHEPHMHELTSMLLTGHPGALRTAWRRGAVAAIDFPAGPVPGTGTLLWMFQPGALRALTR